MAVSIRQAEAAAAAAKRAQRDAALRAAGVTPGSTSADAAERRIGRTTQTLSNIDDTKEDPSFDQPPMLPAASRPSTPRPLNFRDAAYNSQIASIQRALQDYETGATTRAQRFGQDYTTSLRNLGFRPGEGFNPTPNIFGATRSMSEAPLSGSFDIEGVYDPYSAAARGTRRTRDEFAGRGTLRSSDFAKTFGEFQDRLQNQLDAMELSRARFGQDLATDVARQRGQSLEREQAAQRDAMLRAAGAAGGRL